MTPSVMAPRIVLTSLRCRLASSRNQLVWSWLLMALAADIARAKVWGEPILAGPTMLSTPAIRPRTSCTGGGGSGQVVMGAVEVFGTDYQGRHRFIQGQGQSRGA